RQGRVPPARRLLGPGGLARGAARDGSGALARTLGPLLRHGRGAHRATPGALGDGAADRPAQLQPPPRRRRRRTCTAGGESRHRARPEHGCPRRLAPGRRPLRRRAAAHAGARPHPRRARQRALADRRPFPGVGVRPLGRARVHHLARVQEDLHGRVDRPGGHRRPARPAAGPARGGRADPPGVPEAAVNAAAPPRHREGRELPPVAAQVDAALLGMDAGLDWLLALNPLGTDALWREFEASGHARVSPLRYAEPVLDLDAMRRRLLALPMDRIESPLLAGLLGEKQRDLVHVLDLVRLRGTAAFIDASVALFGTVEPELLALARRLLEQVVPGEPLEADLGVDAVVAAVEDEVAWYRGQAPDFSLDVVVDADIGSLMMVWNGRLYLAAGLRLPSARLQPLLQHEVGTHVVTHYIGSGQPLRQLGPGLAGYDPLQEGLGVLAEFLAGYLPGERLRILAARVIAADMAVRRQGIPAIFACLHEQHGFATDEAFDVAVRALRGGGLTKDAVYLRGLCELLDDLGQGGAFEPLFAGKFALRHRRALDRLVEEGWAVPPRLLPRYATAPGFRAALAQCRRLDVSELHHAHPTPLPLGLSP